MVNRTKELKYRLEEKRKEIEKELVRAIADAQGEKNDRIEKLENKLNELKESLKINWDNLTENAVNKLNELLK